MYNNTIIYKKLKIIVK